MIDSALNFTLASAQCYTTFSCCVPWQHLFHPVGHVHTQCTMQSLWAPCWRQQLTSAAFTALRTVLKKRINGRDAGVFLAEKVTNALALCPNQEMYDLNTPDRNS